MRRCLVVAFVCSIVVASTVALSGCKGGGTTVANTNIQIAPSEANTAIESGVSAASMLGLKALSKDDATFAKIKEYSKTAKEVIDGSILPLFQGADLNSVTAATADQAMKLLNDKLNPMLKGAIQLAINSALLFVKLPANPTDKLSDSQRGIIVAIFKGLSGGIASYQSWGGPTARDAEVMPVIVEMDWHGGKRP